MKNLRVNLGNRSYDIIIGRDIRDEIGKYVLDITGTHSVKILLVTDSNVEKLHGKELLDILMETGFEVYLFTIPAGEKSKSPEMLQKIYDKLIEHKFTRSDMLCALGGGVTGDLVGYAAATYMRGIRFFQIPTSLLAQVDSSVGGKTGIDLPQAKNVVGCFYQPAAVYADSYYLTTLEPKFLRDGLSEVVKYAVLRSGMLLDNIRTYKRPEDFLANSDEMVYACCDIKREIVEHDECDTGERMLLNFGHTIGHSIESHFNYCKYTHGEGVAIGMVEIARF
ncbi:MAG: 3-dehydroquinate synthase, partial [Clostridiales bacterium]|nr:3-dehydroquinate synthase [Clostridiales bacterium]